MWRNQVLIIHTPPPQAVISWSQLFGSMLLPSKLSSQISSNSWASTAVRLNRLNTAQTVTTNDQDVILCGLVVQKTFWMGCILNSNWFGHCELCLFILYQADNRHNLLNRLADGVPYNPVGHNFVAGYLEDIYINHYYYDIISILWDIWVETVCPWGFKTGVHVSVSGTVIYSQWETDGRRHMVYIASLTVHLEWARK